MRLAIIQTKCIFRILRFLSLISLCIIANSRGYSQVDTVPLKYDEILILKDTFFLGTIDSIVILQPKSKYKIKKNRDIKDKAFYDSLASKTKTNNHLYSLYKSILVEDDKKQPEENPNFEIASNEFNIYKGDVIRNIIFRSVDLFEGNINDTTRSSITGLGKVLNNTHKQTRESVLRKSLRFKEGEQVEPGKFSENERLYRGLPYIEDAKIIINKINPDSDTVDVYIITQDNFPIGLGAEVLDYDHFVLEPYHRNVLGTGDEISLSMIYKGRAEPPFGWGAKYISTNIAGSLTDGLVEFTDREQVNFQRIRFSRLFRTNDMHFGGELELLHLTDVKYWREYTPDSVINYSSIYTKNLSDSWVAKSFFLQSGKYHKTINFAYRYHIENYLRNPDVLPDSNYVFHDFTFHMGALTLQNIRYYKTTKLLSFGVTEDVPYGYRLNFSFGYQKTQFYHRPYAGFSVGVGKHLAKFGYMVFSFKAGSFFRENQYEDLQLEVNLSHISELMNKGRFSMRNIIVSSFNSTGHILYNDQINFGNNIRGLKQSEIFGQSTYSIQNDYRIYTPWSFIGFKLALGPFADIGWISQHELLRHKKDFYAALGLGIHIKNESLTFPTFTTRVSYYPSWQNGGSKFNVSFIFSDKKLFRLSGQPKPVIVGYD